MSEPITTRPENRYETVTVDEAAGFPAPGERRFNQNGVYEGRDIGFIPFGRELYGRKFYFKRNEETAEIAARERIMGVLSRETPTSTMASVFGRFLDWAHNLADIEQDENAAPQNLMFVLSGPGVGKTHLPKVMSKAFGYDHELIGSGEAGGDIDELVIAHEFKGNSAGDIFKTVEAALTSPENGVIKQQLITKLSRQNFLEDYVDDQGQKAHRLNLAEIMKAPAEGAVRSAADEKQMDANIETVWQIAKDCRLDVKDQGEGIGIQKVNGRLLTKLLQMKEQYDRSGKAEPVIITLDEFNRFKSFGKKLQNFWEVVGGASPEPVTLVDAAGARHTFTPEMLKYVFVYMTGNDPKKVPGARELDYSMLDRIGENRTFRLEDFGARDWQHRFEQQLMGIGIDMHYRAGSDHEKGDNYWASNPAEFTRHLLAKRVQGISPKEERQFTQMQRQMLENWDSIHRGTGQVGDFLSEWPELYAKHKNELRDLPSIPEISPRLIIHLMNDLRTPKAGSASFLQNMKAKLSGTPIPQEKLSAANLGTKFCAAIKGMVDKTHPNSRSELRQALYLGMYKHGIVSREEMVAAGYETPEMQATRQPELVRDLLNTDLNRYFDKELLPLQKALAETIRQRYPEQREKSDNDLVSMAELKAATAKIKEREKELKETGRPSDMPPVFQQVLLPQLSMSRKGVVVDFAPGVIVDSIMRDEQVAAPVRATVTQAIATKKKAPGTLATTSEMLMGLALAEDTTTQVTSLFNREVGKASEISIAASMVKVSKERHEKVVLFDGVRNGSISEEKAVDQLRKGLTAIALRTLKEAAKNDPAKLAEIQRNPENQVGMKELKEALAKEMKEFKHNNVKVSERDLNEKINTLAQRQAQLDPSYQGDIVRDSMQANVELLMENRHPSGLAFTALTTNGFDASRPEGQQNFVDSLNVISLSQPDAEQPNGVRTDTLIVGFTPIAAELQAYLKDVRHITYVCASDENAQATVLGALKNLTSMARATLTSQDATRNHPDATETKNSGLSHTLRSAVICRHLEGSTDAWNKSMARNQNASLSDADRAIEDIADKLLDAHQLVSKQSKRQAVTRLSWSEMLSEQGRSDQRAIS